LECGTSIPELEPRIFSFNSPHGACDRCHGLGFQKVIDPELIVPDPTLSLAEGALQPWNRGVTAYWRRLIAAVAEENGVDVDRPWQKLKKAEREIFLNGTGGERHQVTYTNRFGRRRSYKVRFEGILNQLQRRYEETDSETNRERIESYMAEQPCPDCGGARLRPESLAVKIGGISIAEYSALSARAAADWIDSLEMTDTERAIARLIVREISERLAFLDNVGIGYLSLSRSARSLSGGEAQRIRLATQIGSSLVGVMYVLDEPSIGLHPRDTQRLIDILKSLRDLGNTVLVVEHDPDTIEAADCVIDLGPGAGELGGHLLFSGSYTAMLREHKSLTGRYLSGELRIPIPNNRHKPNGKFLRLAGANLHNLQNVDLMVPLGTLTVVTGVSGSGKSTLVHDVLYRALAAKHNGNSVKEFCDRLDGDGEIREAVIVDQSPIGRTPRSNPATYLKAFDAIRDVFAETPDAKRRGYSAGHFSFNVPGGRCETCQGDGTVTVEMQFLADVELVCEECRGTRFKSGVLDVKFHGKNIHDVLQMTVREALTFFGNVPKIISKLKVLSEIGLGYLRLGQSATTLSGGEAQRLKLAAHLTRSDNRGILYILDEPTTGLHFDDIAKLLAAFRKLLESGASLLVIEHNLDVIKSADWLIDMGPEGGDRGGKIIATGTPEQVARNAQSHTARFLAKVLSANGQAKRLPNGASKSSGPSATIATGANTSPSEP
jgi:excinuclease ABC subunit A